VGGKADALSKWNPNVAVVRVTRFTCDWCDERVSCQWRLFASGLTILQLNACLLDCFLVFARQPAQTLCVCMCMCVCVCARACARARVCVCVCVVLCCVVCVCVCVCVFVCVCICVRTHACICMWECMKVTWIVDLVRPFAKERIAPRALIRSVCSWPCATHEVRCVDNRRICLIVNVEAVDNASSGLERDTEPVVDGTL
jgi:hypothetical protein